MSFPRWCVWELVIKKKEEKRYFSTAERTSDLSIFPPRLEARSIAPDFDIVQPNWDLQSQNQIYENQAEEDIVDDVEVEEDLRDAERERE